MALVLKGMLLFNNTMVSAKQQWGKEPKCSPKSWLHAKSIVCSAVQPNGLQEQSTHLSAIVVFMKSIFLS